MHIDLNIMKRPTICLCLLLFLSSCQYIPQYYDYIEIVEEESVFGGTDLKEEDAEKIKSASDSAAYLEAYRKFMVSQAIYEEMIDNYGHMYKKPIDFKLVNREGVDISKITFFASKEERESQIRETQYAIVEGMNIGSHSNSEAGMNTDSIRKAKEAQKAYENRPWKLSRFTDEFGDPTDKKFYIHRRYRYLFELCNFGGNPLCQHQGY